MQAPSDNQVTDVCGELGNTGLFDLYIYNSAETANQASL